MEPVGEFTPCFLRVVARFSALSDPNTLNHEQLSHTAQNFQFACRFFNIVIYKILLTHRHAYTLHSSYIAHSITHHHIHRIEENISSKSDHSIDVTAVSKENPQQKFQKTKFYC
jgi:hypothetical protein